MTAVLFLKQTRSLFAQGKYMDAIEEKYYAPTRRDDPQEVKEETTQESSRYVWLYKILIYTTNKNQ